MRRIERFFLRSVIAILLITALAKVAIEAMRLKSFCKKMLCSFDGRDMIPKMGLVIKRFL